MNLNIRLLGYRYAERKEMDRMTAGGLHLSLWWQVVKSIERE